MTTIILTIIGILLAAAAALMVIFYGGDAFNAGSVGARANTLQNAGTNVISALQLAKADGNAYSKYDGSDVSKLHSTTNKDDDYLKELPNFANVNTTGAVTVSLSDGTLTLGNIPADVCKRVNKNLGLTAAPSSNDKSLKMGCVEGTATGAGFFANA